MKKILQKTILLNILLMGIITINAQRNVAWVHGLDGDASSWENYNRIFDSERKINSLRTSYNTDNGINNAGNQVRSAMNSFGNGAKNASNIGIGHSMGGLMIRDVDRTTTASNKVFGGYITVTSPNYGAPISNSLLDGSVTAAAQNACNKIADGPLAQVFSLPWGIVSNLATNTLCKKFIDNDLVQTLQGTPVTNADLRVGSPTINAINNYNSSLPRISMWGEETSPVHWRMFGSTLNNNDSSLLGPINSGRGVYHGFYVYNTSLAVVTGVAGFWNPFLWGLTATYTYRATQWKKGRNWIDDSENIWSSLIKTTRREAQKYWTNTWIPCAYPPRIEVQQKTAERLPPDEDCGEWKWVQRTRYVSVNYPSDGLLPQYTQELQGIPNDNKYKVEGANHIEVRNMGFSPQGDITREQFNEIFNRDDWFGTPKN
jgi:hypothetical protein